MRLLLLINSNNKRELIGMKAGLTEIGSAGLFHEYLQTLGINKPPLTSIDKQWEYSIGGAAPIVNDDKSYRWLLQGRLTYYLP